jgi:catecholate siderophore receptor
MSSVRVPGSLRSPVSKPANASPTRKDVSTTSLLTAACFAAASPASIALAQGTTPQAPLPPLSVEAKQAKKKATTAPAKKAGAAPVVPSAAAASTPTPGSNPYANPNAPYKVEQSASGKLTEPLVNTPRTVTAVPEVVIEDKGARDLRDLARSVPGLTIGSAEGGNSYGAFAIRGFKANNDIFVDSIRNPGNVIPDVFSVQQVEIYMGPSGGIAGRSTIGGAVNIITKEPDLRSSFTEVTTTLGTDKTFRTTVDANQKVSPDFAVRANLMYDTHDVAGRDFVDSERWGGLISATGRLSESVRFTLDYYRYRNDATPDWGVPVLKADHVPITEFGVPRSTWVGMLGLDFFKERADIVTGTVVVKMMPGVTLTNRSRVGESELDYVATSMEGAPDVHHPNRDQTARIYANQTELNVKFNTGPFHHDMVAGLELTRETIDRFGYNITNNYDTLRPFPPNPYVQIDKIIGKGRVYDATIDTAGIYLTDTVHLSKQWIVNGGIRLDDFTRDQVGGPGINAPGSAAANTAIATNTASVHADLLSWNVGVVTSRYPFRASMSPTRQLKARSGASSIPPARNTTASAPRWSTCPRKRRGV